MKRQTAHLRKSLRSLMHKEGISAYLVPSVDAHNSEYLAECHQRRAFISGKKVQKNQFGSFTCKAINIRRTQ